VRFVVAALLLCAVLSVVLPSVAAGAGDSTSVLTGPRQEEARIPFKQTAESDGAGLVVRMIGGFVVVALLALASVYVLKRYFPSLYAHSSVGSRRIQVLETRRLTPRATLFLVEIDGVQILLAQSGDHVVNLHRTVPVPTDVRDPSTIS